MSEVIPPAGTLTADLHYVRTAVERRDGARLTPLPVALIWGTYVIVGYTLIDVAPRASSVFFLVGGVVGSLATAAAMRQVERRLGEADAIAQHRARLHWSGMLLPVLAVIGLAVTHQVHGQLAGQMVAIIGGTVYWYSGVHYDRLYLVLGPILMFGAVLVGVVPAYGWTMLGLVTGLGLIVPAFVRRARYARA